ncbi:damage-control phosphatase ARMT1 [Aplysia californica]|nr:damage-control phosphatase ARMT1 [Aplysia californica]
MDNAGFELLSDWCLAEFLLSSGLATSVHFHIKAMPWFVSDVTEKDFNWTLHQMSAMNHIAMSQLAQKWKQRLNDKTWIIEVDNYWTMPNDYAQMEELNPALYQQLSQADLVIFKGDLNYRKLVGDLKWDYTTDFQTSLRGFLPAPLCALRALKSNSVTGLKKGQAEVAEKESSQWMVTGEWAVLSFSSGKTTSQPCAC